MPKIHQSQQKTGLANLCIERRVKQMCKPEQTNANLVLYITFWTSDNTIGLGIWDFKKELHSTLFEMQ